jgi:hypothetical protein
VALPALGRWALLYVAVLFAVLHIGYLSVADVLFVGAVGLLFGYIVRLSGSILGVTLAHGLTNIVLFLLLPSLEEYSQLSAATATTWLIGVGLLSGLLALALLAWVKLFSRVEARPAVSIGERLRELRTSRGLSYVSLALHTGVPARIIAEIELGLRAIQPEELRRIATGLNIGHDSLQLAALPE